MLPFDFDYYRPETLQEAADLYQKLEQEGKQPFIYSGGTELITLGRINLAYTEAVIDIKGIAESQVMQFSGDYLILGSTLSLTKIEEGNLFPLLTKAAREVADHTARGKITLGGNICAQIFYRETVLPFLLCDSLVYLASPEGKRVVPINHAFQGHLQLAKNEFLVHVATEKQFLTVPYHVIKRRQQWDMGYPLITLAALKVDQGIRVAISGLCPFPFRSSEIEEAVNKQGLSVRARAEGALAVLPKPILDDVEGSAEYRLFVLQNLLEDAITTLDSVV